MSNEQDKKLMIVKFTTHVESIRTNTPEVEVARIMSTMATLVLCIIHDGKVIYAKIER